MNIVIKAGSASLTQFSSNLSYLVTDITVYHNLESNPNINFISSQGFQYRCSLNELAGRKEGNFTAYSITFDSVLPEGDYTIEVIESDKTISISTPIHLKQSTAPSGETTDMFDEHNCLLVVGRTIQVVPDQVHLLAEDENSQEIRFKIRNRYDNINFLSDPNKQVEIDFIPAEWELIKQEIIKSGNFDPDNFDIESEYICDIIEQSMIYQDPQNPDYMIVRWIVPLAATQKAGAVKIALAITDPASLTYVWQTGVANLTVQPNIGRRNKYATIDLESPVAKIENRVDALENIFNGKSIITLEDGGNEE